MSTTKLNYTDLILSNFPVEVKVSHVQSWIGQDDQESRRSIIEFIFHRIHHRYIVPLFHVPKEYKSGFLMMASGCLMIETMQSFYTGVMDTKCKSRETF